MGTQTLHAWRDFVFDLLFPVECLSCGRAGEWLCGRCSRELPLAGFQYCLHCKKPSPSGAFCPACAPAYALDGVLIASDYDNPLVAELIKDLKYRQIRPIADIFGSLLAGFFASNITKRQTTSKSDETLPLLASALAAPIPLHARRRRWRGFNQAELIARSFATGSNLPLAADDLVRTGHRTPQAKLNEKARKNNVAGCFAWRGRPLRGENFLLIDDVVTTGSTLNEAAKTLKAAGAGLIWGLVVAKG